jgi:hypothetical protein
VISLVQKRRDYSKEDQRNSDRGSNPKGEFRQGEHPQGENDPLPLISKGGEIVTLM